jgi:hypothetical protein
VVLEQTRLYPALPPPNQTSVTTSEHRVGGWEGCPDWPADCVPRSEWFGFPIPADDGRDSARGHVTLRVDYGLFPGTALFGRTPDWEYWAVDAEPTEDAAITLQFDQVDLDPDTLDTSVDATVSSALPRRFTAMRYSAGPFYATVPLGGEPVTAATIRAEELAPGVTYDFDVAYLDDAGTEIWVPSIGQFRPDALLGTVRMEVDLETLDKDAAGIAGLDVGVRGFARSLGVGCISRGEVQTFTVADGLIGIIGPLLDIQVSLDNPTAGDDCWGTPSGNPQPLQARFSFPLDQLPGCDLGASEATGSEVVGIASPLRVTVRVALCAAGVVPGPEQ